jgi:hypothetical protein
MPRDLTDFAFCLDLDLLVSLLSRELRHADGSGKSGVRLPFITRLTLVRKLPIRMGIRRKVHMKGIVDLIFSNTSVYLLDQTQAPGKI